MTTPSTTVIPVETHVDTPEGAPVLTSTAVLDAPIAAVHRACVEADLLVRWWGPQELTSRVERWEPQAGGSWRIVHVAPSGDEYGFHGVFHSVTDTQVVWTFEFEGAPGNVSLQTITLEDLGDGTTKVVDQAVFQTEFARDMMADTGARDFAPT
ncbi:MAG TPA: SRPBCC domain-containing protein, partial [Acidimicrobiales bacterium]